MIGTSAILQEEYFDHFIKPFPHLFREETKEEVLDFADIELLVTDSETGRPISKAMISVDTIGRTAVSDIHGKVLINDVVSGGFIVDVIVFGYTANSTLVHVSAKELNTLNVRMVRNC